MKGTHGIVASGVVLELFRKYQSRPFVFVEPGGNWGDHLIYVGARKLARLAGISYRTVTYPEFDPTTCEHQSVIYIHGSGGYVPWWSQTPVHAMHKALGIRGGVTILGPTTFSLDSSYLLDTLGDHVLRRTCEAVYLLCRDRESHAAVRQCLASAAGLEPTRPAGTDPFSIDANMHMSPTDVFLALDHDTALNLSASDLVMSLPPGRFKLYAIRRDREGIGGRRGSPFSLRLDPAKFCNSFNQWVALHCLARQIVTDRLHSAILGAVLGRPTVFLPGSYHKNRAVWEYSLRERGVDWADLESVGWAARLVQGVPVIRGAFASRAWMLLSARLFYGLHPATLESSVDSSRAVDADQR